MQAEGNRAAETTAMCVPTQLIGAYVVSVQRLSLLAVSPVSRGETAKDVVYRRTDTAGYEGKIRR